MLAWFGEHGTGARVVQVGGTSHGTAKGRGPRRVKGGRARDVNEPLEAFEHRAISTGS